MTHADDLQRDIEDLRHDLDVERRYLNTSERAEADGRVCNRDEWLQTLDRRRARIRRMEAELAELTSRLEEAA